MSGPRRVINVYRCSIGAWVLFGLFHSHDLLANSPLATTDSIFQAIHTQPLGPIHFKETRTLKALKSPLLSEGVLEYLPPDTLIKHIKAPQALRYELSPSEIRVTDETKGDTKSLPTETIPELGLIAESLIDLLTADKAGLESHWLLSIGGSMQKWHLALTPRENGTSAIRLVTFDGQGGRISKIHILQADDSESDLVLSLP
jgi:Outer membrane lipoprotein carrier protein LolA-like